MFQNYLKKIIKEKAYKQDYDSLTTQLLEENVPYDTVIATLKKVAESSIFENNSKNEKPATGLSE